MSRGPFNMGKEGPLPRERLETIRAGPLEGDVYLLRMSYDRVTNPILTILV
jgi:hypothetical protein